MGEHICPSSKLPYYNNKKCKRCNYRDDSGDVFYCCYSSEGYCEYSEQKLVSYIWFRIMRFFKIGVYGQE